VADGKMDRRNTPDGAQTSTLHAIYIASVYYEQKVEILEDGCMEIHESG
jgi:hypothetical protein